MVQAHINRIATRVPPHDIHARFSRFAVGLAPPDRRPLFEKLHRRAGIDHRWSVLAPPAPEDDATFLDADGHYRFGAFPSTGVRMGIYDREAAPLAEAAVRDLDVPLHRVTDLVVCSCTGFAAPGPDLQLVQRLGLPLETRRTLIGFMGCYAAINALRAADAIVRADPEAGVLVVALELCSLHAREAEDVEALLGLSVFGDGCAAAFVSADAHGLSLEAFRTTVIPEAQHLITWRVGDYGFDMNVSSKVAQVLKSALPPAVDALMDGANRQAELWAIHPGARSILDAAGAALDLDDVALEPSREVLRRYGNMSSPSVMFVLRTMMERAPASGSVGIGIAFGPGLTAEAMRFRVA